MNDRFGAVETKGERVDTKRNMGDVVMEDATKGKEPEAEAEKKQVEKVDAKGKKRLEIKKWNAVTLWSWDIVVDNCAICRNHIMDLCKSRGQISHAKPWFQERKR